MAAAAHAADLLRYIKKRHYISCGSDMKVKSSLQLQENRRSTYAMEKLDEKQAEFVQYIFENPGSMSVIQARPGCGKTHTLLTMAHHSKVPVLTVIYKHDALHPFKVCSNVQTNASFLMERFRRPNATTGEKSLPKHIRRTDQMTNRMSAVEFVFTLLSHLQNFSMHGLRGMILLFDEYTLMPKMYLLTLVIMLKFYEITTIFCGDRNQLQSITNSKHTPISSHDIVARFADRQFEFLINHRCSETYHNSIIDYVSTLSSEDKLDPFAFSFLSTVYMEQILNYYDVSQLQNIIMASTHRELAMEMNNLTTTFGIVASFYQIASSGSPENVNGLPTQNGLYRPNAAIEYEQGATIRNSGTVVPPNWPDKFLPYIPLIVGADYYIKEYSEQTLGQLIRIEMDGEMPRRLHFQRGTNERVILVPEKNNKVQFDLHRDWLLGKKDGKTGQIYNFPIYPHFMMSLHMAQGKTIVRNVNILVSRYTTYQALYVALSRVKSGAQISRIVMPECTKYIISSIVNFPELCDPECPIDMHTVHERLNSNYKLYGVYHQASFVIMYWVLNFALSRDKTVRSFIRKNIIEYTKEIAVVQPRQQRTESICDEADSLLINSILDHSDLFLILAHINEVDSRVWLWQYSKLDPEFQILLNTTNAATSSMTILREFTKFDDYKELFDSVCHFIEHESVLVNCGPSDPNYKYLIQDFGTGKCLISTPIQSAIYHGIKNNTLSKKQMWQLLKDELEADKLTILEPNKNQRYEDRYKAATLAKSNSVEKAKSSKSVTPSMTILDRLRLKRRQQSSGGIFKRIKKIV